MNICSYKHCVLLGTHFRDVLIKNLNKICRLCVLLCGCVFVCAFVCVRVCVR